MTTASAAQDEFNELIRDKHTEDRHPEDRLNDSDASEPDSPGALANDYHETLDTDDELDLPADMRANYYMPNMRSEANTGPKGVIADAQAFEQAKKQARRFTWKAKNNAASGQNYNVTTSWQDEKSSDEESDDSFMRAWRDQRLKELQNVGERIRSRTNSPSRRIYGGMPLVDGLGYLDAVDKTAPSTVVVVFVFERDLSPDNELCRYETIMHEVAKRNDTVRFVKMFNDDAELHPSGVPAVLAYKAGEKFADVVALHKALPRDSELSAVSLETIFRQHRIL
ncbi:hypothetical protein J1614_003224 [Plenodomus biglobosus]|nr:hypothetical protein J1614_003224 [Plenodomus biglobosus]